MKNVELKNIITHLRFPFSLLLLPVYLFALLTLDDFPYKEAFFLFLILHLLVYPSSNGYNSLMDDDKGSIGGIKTPPKVPTAMLWVTIVMDTLALGLVFTLFIDWVFICLLAYILASRAYSYRKIRLKKYPLIGFLTVTIFQGPIIFLLTILALSPSEHPLFLPLALAISYLIIAAGYPLSQIYQHQQDKADGVKTISIMLGIRGTFILSGILFFVLSLLFVIYFGWVQKDILACVMSLVFLAPVGLFFGQWMYKCFQDPSHADFENTMTMNKLGALSINLTFLTILLKNNFFG